MRVCIVPRVRGIGGMVSFRDRLKAVFERWGIQVTQELEDFPYQAVLVIGGTRQLLGLWKARQRGIPVVQRLDGMNWLHRLPPAPNRPRFSLRHILRAELANLNLALIRRRLATAIVYQSQFARQWWEQRYGSTPQPNRVIYNGVDLSLFNPQGDHQRPSDRLRILMVEGSLGGGYEWGLRIAVRLVEEMRSLQAEWGRLYPHGIELMIAGQVAEGLRQAWDQAAGNSIRWQGRVAPSEIPYLDRSAHLLYSADVHPACPNSVIEALACGLPVLAFETGSLPELLTTECGRVVPYGGDAWRLEEPDVRALAQAGVELALRQEAFRPAARARAEAVFNIEATAKAYAEVLAIFPAQTSIPRGKDALPFRSSSQAQAPLQPPPSFRETGTTDFSDSASSGKADSAALSPDKHSGRSIWLEWLGRLSRFTPLSLKRFIYRLPWLANWLRQRVNRSVGRELQWVEITAGGLRGLSMWLDLSQEKDYWLGTYEPHLQTAIQELVQRGQVVYDVGANVGYVTLLLARCVGVQGKVIALEPFPQNVRRLQQNLTANSQLADMQIVAAAIVESSEEVTFRIGPSDDTGRVVDSSSLSLPPAESVIVAGVSLDDLVYQQGFPCPQVIKIDIEGGEVSALRGMKRLLQEAQPLLLLETHTQQCSQQVWEILTHFGYRISWMKRGYPPLTGREQLPRRAYWVAFPPQGCSKNDGNS